MLEARFGACGRALAIGLLALGLLLPAVRAMAQAAAGDAVDPPRHTRGTAAGPEQQLRGRANSGTVGIISGGVDGTYIRIAADLSSVLDSNELRVLAIAGKGSVQNTIDVMYLRGVDIGIVQSDVLAYLKRERLIPGVEKTMQYIAKLYNEELHLLAKDAQKLADLAGKKVNVDVQGSGTFITATLLFDKLGIAVEPTHYDQALALEKLKAGEIAALAYVAGKPTRLFRDLKAEDGLHFIAVPATDALLDTYLPSSLGSGDYPGLVPSGSSVDTIAVGAVMSVYGWPRGSDRYRKVARFIDAFFSRFNEFLQPPRHAKWKEVNLAAQLPGWSRFPVAEEWLKTAAARSEEQQRQAFGRFLSQTAPAAGGNLSAREREALFSQFLEWQKTAGGLPSPTR